MISPGTDVFLCLGNCPPDDRLRRGSIRDVDEGMYTVEFRDPATPPETGQQVFLLYDRGGDFTRQAATVVTVEGPFVQLRTRGAAESAERRRVQRVSYLQVFRQVVEEPLVSSQ